MQHNRRSPNEKDSRRPQSQRSNYAAEDSRRRFEDQDYDNYFPQQNAYHPRNERSESQFGSQSGIGYGTRQDYSSSRGPGSNYGSRSSDFGSQPDYQSGVTDYGSRSNMGYRSGQQNYGSNSSFQPSSESQYGSYSGIGYGTRQDYSDNQNMSATYGSNNQSQRYNEYPNFQNSNRSDFSRQDLKDLNRSSDMYRGSLHNPSSSYGYGSYGFDQGSAQSWSQPVRNDEVSQHGKSFFGKGPKGFKRSDERIREEVSEALFRDNSVDASEIEVTVKEGEVTLSGTVDSRTMKRLAEDCAEAVTGVSDVRNEIRVQSQSSSSASSLSSSDKSDRTINPDETASNDRSSSASTSADRTDKSKNRGSIANKLM